MFILDTNVVSELRKARLGTANQNVISWASGIPEPMLFISAITVLQLEIGILSIGRRDVAQGAVLRVWLDEKVLPAFAGRILAFDEIVASRCAALHVPDRRAEADAMIAATALTHGLTIATRNIYGFEGTGVNLINPWDPLT